MKLPGEPSWLTRNLRLPSQRYRHLRPRFGGHGHSRLLPVQAGGRTDHTRAASTANRPRGIPTSLKDLLKVSEEVEHALATNRPVVALESTIYTHGALGVDLGLESLVRENGAVPAVIGILDGVPSIGLTPAEVQRMMSEGASKVSRRDLAYVVGLVRSRRARLSSLLVLRDV